MKFTNFLTGALIMILMQSCLKDKGNYEYDYGNEVNVTFPITGSVPGRLGDTVLLEPTRQYLNATDTTAYDHEWYVDGELYSTSPSFEFVPTVMGNVSVNYYMVDRQSGVRYASNPATITINVTSPFQNGWAILYEENGVSELGHVRDDNGVYTSYKNLYREYNDGEQMGSLPVKMQDYQVTGGRGLFIVQQGGQGSIELNSYSLKKQLVAAQSFTAGAPAGFAPVDAGFYFSASLLVNADGKVYARFFPMSAIAYTTPWMSTPVQIPGGMLLSDIWDSWSGASYMALMFDKLNKRVLMAGTGFSYTSSGGIVITPLRNPQGGYPDDFTPLDNLGDWEYRWGGTFGDDLNSAVGAMILRNPADNNFYYQSFGLRISNGQDIVTPQRRVLFSGSSLVNDDTIFEVVKKRNYIFFNSGNTLYYYDALTGATREYTRFNSKITSIRVNDQGAIANLGRIVAVGTEDGTFAMFDITDPTLISGQPLELYRTTGFGKIVDIINKGGRNTN